VHVLSSLKIPVTALFLTEKPLTYYSLSTTIRRSTDIRQGDTSKRLLPPYQHSARHSTYTKAATKQKMCKQDKAGIKVLI